MKCLSFLTAILLCMTSCQQELNEIEKPISDEFEANTEVKFIYNGINYYSQCILNEDSSLYILDEETRRIAEILGNNPTLSTFIHNNGEIEYYDNIDQIINNGIVIEESGDIKKTRAEGLTNMYVELYEDTNYKGWVLKDETSYGITKHVPKLEKKYNNKISSIKFTRRFGLGGGAKGQILYIFYEKDDFGGLAMSMGGSVSIDGNKGPNVANIPNLKAFRISPTSSINWNDRISSYRLILGGERPKDL